MKKIKIGIGTIILTATVSYLVRYWFYNSGLEHKLWNKYTDFKDIFEGDK